MEASGINTDVTPQPSRTGAPSVRVTVPGTPDLSEESTGAGCSVSSRAGSPADQMTVPGTPDLPERPGGPKYARPPPVSIRPQSMSPKHFGHEFSREGTPASISEAAHTPASISRRRTTSVRHDASLLRIERLEQLLAFVPLRHPLMHACTRMHRHTHAPPLRMCRGTIRKGLFETVNNQYRCLYPRVLDTVGDGR